MKANEALEFLGQAVRYINGGQGTGPPDGIYRLVRIEQVTREVAGKLISVVRFEIEELNERWKSYWCTAEHITAPDSEKEPELEIRDAAVDRL